MNDSESILDYFDLVQTIYELMMRSLMVRD